METRNDWDYSTEVCEFKSYYVVWKPVNTGTTVNRQFEFKSYYVVWKPSANNSFVTQCREFKSYYVVWKL